MSTLSVTNIQSLASATLPVIRDSAGTEYGRFVRAYVNFVGSTGAINSQFNVSSVTRNATGNYTINFTNQLNDNNYAVSGFAPGTTGVAVCGVSDYTGWTPTSSSCPIKVYRSDTMGLQDAATVTAMFVR